MHDPVFSNPSLVSGSTACDILSEKTILHLDLEAEKKRDESSIFQQLNLHEKHISS